MFHGKHCCFVYVLIQNLLKIIYVRALRADVQSPLFYYHTKIDFQPVGAVFIYIAINNGC